MNNFDDYLKNEVIKEKDNFQLPESFDNNIEDTLANLDNIDINKKNKWFRNKKVWAIAACFVFVCLTYLGLNQNLSLTKNDLDDRSRLRTAAYDGKESDIDNAIGRYRLNNNETLNNEDNKILRNIPKLKIIVGNREEYATIGYYSLSQNGENICSDTVASPDLVKYNVPLAIKSNEEIKLGFYKDISSYRVKLWKGNFSGDKINYDNVKATEYNSKDLNIQAPSKSGIYVFEVIGSWEWGEISYSFKIEVK